MAAGLKRLGPQGDGVRGGGSRGLRAGEPAVRGKRRGSRSRAQAPPPALLPGRALGGKYRVSDNGVSVKSVSIRPSKSKLQRLAANHSHVERGR